jgi:hypothetical protein
VASGSRGHSTFDEREEVERESSEIPTEVFALSAAETDLLWGLAPTPIEIFPTRVKESDGTHCGWVFWGLGWLFDPGEAVNHINRSVCPLQDLPPINAFSADWRVVKVTQAEQLREGFNVSSRLWASVSSRTTDERSPNAEKWSAKVDSC